MELSPKLVTTVAIPLIAAAILAILTGDKSFLLAILLTLVGGGVGVAVKPAPNVTQAEVNALSRSREPEPPK